MEQIKSIFYKEIAYPYSNNQYGLAIIIMMQKKCLYFDSSSFYFVKSPSDNFNKQKWNIVSDLMIIRLRQFTKMSYPLISFYLLIVKLCIFIKNQMAMNVFARCSES